MAFTPNVIDIEASGFGSTSYPIEIGVVTGNGSRYCRLIKPYSQWCHWDKQAEQTHGISRELLFEKGLEGRIICSELNRLYANQTLYCDGWVVDYPWMICLFEHAGVAMQFRMSAIELLLEEQQLALWQVTKQRIETILDLPRHRASNDAVVIQRTFLQLAND